jgi:hypothetical protein
MPTYTGKLESLKRLPTSRNGNPRYMVCIDGVFARTSPDSSLAYKLPNYVGKTVQIDVDLYYGKPTLLNIREV